MCHTCSPTVPVGGSKCRYREYPGGAVRGRQSDGLVGCLGLWEPGLEGSLFPSIVELLINESGRKYGAHELPRRRRKRNREATTPVGCALPQQSGSKALFLLIL